MGAVSPGTGTFSRTPPGNTTTWPASTCGSGRATRLGRSSPSARPIPTTATTGGAGSPRAPDSRTRSVPSCASRTESSRSTTSGAAYRAPATPSRSWSVTVPTVTEPNADGWRVMTAEPSPEISAIG